MSAYGVTPAGFIPKPLTQIKADLEDAFRAAFGATWKVDPESATGQIIGMMSERFSELWLLGQATYSAQDPDAAEAAALDAVCAITGTLRAAGTKAHAKQTHTGITGTLLPAGSAVSSGAGHQQYYSAADVSIAAAAAWQATYVYVTGNRVKNAGNVYECILSGTSAGSGGPTTTASDIVDNTAHWTYLGVGDGSVDAVHSTSSVGGSTAEVARAIQTIETPVAGWQGTINREAAIAGTGTDTDAALRTRRVVELQGRAATTVDAIRDAVLKVADVTSCAVYENVTDGTDGDGLLPHSIEAVVLGGVEADIEAAVFSAKPSGINTNGATSGTVTDSQGIDHTIKFQRPTAVPIYVRVDVIKDASLYPTTGDADIKAAVAAFGNLGGVGKDAVSSSLGAQAFKVAGVLDVVLTYIKTSATPTSPVTIAVDKFHIATYDAANVTVNSSSGTP